MPTRSSRSSPRRGDVTTDRPFRHCPYCGSTLKRDPRPSLVCSSCEAVIYQNPKPVVAAIIEKDGKVLLARRAAGLRAGKWDLPGGFVELDETAEEALVREVREEVGCEVRLHGVLGVFREVTGAYGPSINIHFRA